MVLGESRASLPALRDVVNTVGTPLAVRTRPADPSRSACGLILAAHLIASRCPDSPSHPHARWNVTRCTFCWLATHTDGSNPLNLKVRSSNLARLMDTGRVEEGDKSASKTALDVLHNTWGGAKGAQPLFPCCCSIFIAVSARPHKKNPGLLAHWRAWCPSSAHHTAVASPNIPHGVARVTLARTHTRARYQDWPACSRPTWTRASTQSPFRNVRECTWILRPSSFACKQWHALQTVLSVAPIRCSGVNEAPASSRRGVHATFTLSFAQPNASSTRDAG